MVTSRVINGLIQLMWCVPGMQLFKFVDGTASDLSKKPFLEMDYSTVPPLLFFFFFLLIYIYIYIYMGWFNA